MFKSNFNEFYYEKYNLISLPSSAPNRFSLATIFQCLQAKWIKIPRRSYFSNFFPLAIVAYSPGAKYFRLFRTFKLSYQFNTLLLNYHVFTCKSNSINVIRWRAFPKPIIIGNYLCAFNFYTVPGPVVVLFYRCHYQMIQWAPQFDFAEHQCAFWSRRPTPKQFFLSLFDFVI